MNYLVSDKLFPFHRDGGTCFTTYEVASFLNSSADVPTQVILHLADQVLVGDNVSFIVLQESLFPARLRFLRQFKRGDSIMLNSAFKPFELLYFVISLFSGAKLYWSAHGSLDVRLCKSFKKRAYLNFWARLISVVIDRYICNSVGEYQQLPNFLQRKAMVVENLLPFATIAREQRGDEKSGGVTGETITKEYFLIFGRIDPKKRIVETILKLNDIGFFETEKLLIAGIETSPGYVKEIESAVKKMQLTSRVRVSAQQISGLQKLRLFQACKALMLFSKSEGLPIVILEAAVLQIPVICSPGCNAEHLQEAVLVRELEDFSMSDLTSLKTIDHERLADLDLGRKKLKTLYA